MGKITEVAFGDDYILIVRFANRHAVLVDMSQRLHTARFSELRDPQVFHAAQTDGKLVCWPGGISMGVSELLEMISK